MKMSVAEYVTSHSIRRGTADRKWIALVDVNNFYVSCEQAFAPRLRGRPVAVLSNNDGCVIARSNELKALGVAMGTPTYKLQALVRRYRAVLLSSNYELYADMSRRFNDLLGRYSDQIEPYSIDETFVALPGLFTNTLIDLATSIEKAIHKEVHLPVALGIATTKTLAKLANQQAKLQPQGRRVYLLEAETAATQKLLEDTPVGAVWGIGKKLAERLNNQGIHTAWQLRQAPESLLKNGFSINVRRTQLELKGINCLPEVQPAKARQQLRVSRSYGRASSEFIDTVEALRSHVNQAAQKLRQQKSVAKALSVFVHTNSFQQNQPQYSATQVWVFDTPTADTFAFMQAAQKLLRRIWRQGYSYHKTGVQLMDLSPASSQQLPLLEATNQIQAERQAKLMQVIDSINQRQGQGTLVVGAKRKVAAWHSRQVAKSPAYTTSWQDLPQVAAR